MTDKSYVTLECCPICGNETGSKTSRGYGVIGIGSSELFYVHRLVYESIHEKIPNNMVICHHCDNPSCVNPKHLFIGTQNDNIIDMRKKGRAYSKLTRENVEKIREMHKLGFSTKKLSEEFKISGDQIRNVVNYKQWR